MSILVLMGSGETSPSMVGVHRVTARAAGAEHVTLLDTPFGFQENADQIVERIEAYFARSLAMPVQVASLRHRNADPVAVARTVATVRSARYVFSGPGSPTYALDIWGKIGLGEALAAVIAGGGTVTLASAAALTAGSHSIPVYEIYKVGQEPFLRAGLDVLGALGLPAMVVPHWNNAEGGNHDTSRCFIGSRRLGLLTDDLDVGLIGIDEHTALVLDFDASTATVAGLGTVTLRGTGLRVMANGESVHFDDLKSDLGVAPEARGREAPERPARSRRLDDTSVEGLLQALLALEESAAVDPGRRQELRSSLVDLATAAERGMLDPRRLVSDYVALLLELRAMARQQRRFEDADQIRSGLEGLGVEVRDTPAGVEWQLNV